MRPFGERDDSGGNGRADPPAVHRERGRRDGAELDLEAPGRLGRRRRLGFLLGDGRRFGSDGGLQLWLRRRLQRRLLRLGRGRFLAGDGFGKVERRGRGCRYTGGGWRGSRSVRLSLVEEND